MFAAVGPDAHVPAKVLCTRQFLEGSAFAGELLNASAPLDAKYY
jgi:hypothetical protein